MCILKTKRTMQKQKQMVGGDTGNRRELDFYPTPPEVTHALMNVIGRFGVIHEPACGQMDMVAVLMEYSDKVLAGDITLGQDYLTLEPKGADAIITNPPFFLAEQFITKALKEAPVVAMLLKGHYWQAKKRYDFFIKNPPSLILPLTWRPDFSGKGAPTMEMAWSVWGVDVKSKTFYLPVTK